MLCFLTDPVPKVIFCKIKSHLTTFTGDLFLQNKNLLALLLVEILSCLAIGFDYVRFSRDFTLHIIFLKNKFLNFFFFNRLKKKKNFVLGF